MALSHLRVGKEGQSQKGKSESRTWGLFLAAAQVGLFINDYLKADHQQPLQKNQLISLETTPLKEISKHKDERL